VTAPLDDLHGQYLARLGVEQEPPSPDALVRLHRAHVERVAYETLWIHTGEVRSIDPAASVAAIADQGRGGYCFQLNGALAALLTGMGYSVTRHVGGVHGPAGPTDEEMGNHLVLVVHGLPSDEHPDGTWYVDVGLGDALHEPLPLRPHEAEQGPFHLSLEVPEDATGDWHLTHDPAGSFSGMTWGRTPVGMDAFAARHVHLSTSPESGFVKVLTAQRRDATGVDVLRGLTLTRVGDHETTSGSDVTTLASRDDLVGVLADVFLLDVSDLDDESADRLWTKVHDAHEAWVAAGSP
jgi:N-hydroxyarylamine O-acetyltransferase